MNTLNEIHTSSSTLPFGPQRSRQQIALNRQRRIVAILLKERAQAKLEQINREAQAMAELARGSTELALSMVQDSTVERISATTWWDTASAKLKSALRKWQS